MSTASIAGIWQRGMASTTVRHFTMAVGFAFSAIGVGVLIYVAEKYLFRVDRRFVENPASVMMRAVGLAHFCIGWLFLFTSPRLRTTASFLQLLALTILGIGLCVICAYCGASRNPFIFLFFYSYFLIHEIRDQTNLYQRYGDAPRDGGNHNEFLLAIRNAAVVFLTGILAFGVLLHATLSKQAALFGELSPIYLLTVGVCFLLLCISVSRHAYRLGTQHYGTLKSAVTLHMPILMVYGGILTVLLAGTAIGAVSFNLIILIHAGAWFVFTTHQLRNRPAPQSKNLWTWIRHTPSGFITLHLAVIGFILVMTAMRVYVWQRVGFVSELFDGENFPYWSLMHISMAFWRPR